MNTATTPSRSDQVYSLAALRFLLVDDHTLVREGLRRILEAACDQWNIDEAENAAQALEQLRRQSYDLLVFDLNLPGVSGMDLVRRVRSQQETVPILVLTMHAEAQYALRAFRSGAQGYVTKDSASSELVGAVRKLLSGGTYVTSSLGGQVLMQLSQPGGHAEAHHRLSAREMEVFLRLISGLRPTDVARVLNMSVKTVSTHKTRIMEKLQLPNTAALIRYGLEHGLVGDTLALKASTQAQADEPLKDAGGGMEPSCPL